MDPRLLHYYNQELQHLRLMGAEFAREFPKIAARLGMDGVEVSDPYVERLLEGVGFLSARVQLKLDAEFPRFTQRFLDCVYPNYQAPMPSMVVAQFNADLNDANLARGITIPRGSSMRKLGVARDTDADEADRAPIEFRTGQDVTLWPIEIVAAEYFSYAPDLPLNVLPVADRIKGGVRLRLRATAGLTFSQIALDRLRLYLAGNLDTVYRLYELCHGAALGAVVTALAQPRRCDAYLPAQHIGRPGFEDTEALLPVSMRMFQGHRLLQEYFAFPQRFLFVDVNRLGSALQRHPAQEIEVVLLFSRGDPTLEKTVDKSHFALHCAPAINLFPKRADRIHVTQNEHRFHVVPDRTRPLDYEVFSVDGVTGFSAGVADQQEFRPFYASYDTDQAGHLAYFSIDREPRVLSEGQRRKGFRSSYVGSEVFLSIVDTEHSPYRQDLRQLAVETQCTNRDMPLLMALGSGKTDFVLDSAAPLQSIRVVHGPSRPYSPVFKGGAEWRFVNLLTLNYLSLVDTDQREGATVLREMLQLYAVSSDTSVLRQIEGVRSLKTEPVVRRLPGRGPICFGRGLQVEVEVDELAFQGGSAFLWGCVMERYFARYVSMNTFAETVVTSRSRGEIHRWVPQWGTRPLL